MYKGIMMKMTIGYFAVVFGLVTSISLAHAGSSLFSRLDTNGDGLISKAEFDAFNDRHFKNLDANNDGNITPEELRAIQAQILSNQGMGHGDGTTHLDQRFFAADANHDGGLDRTEAVNMPMLSKYFDEVDANKDGKVTRQEYFDAMPLLHGVKKMDITGKSQTM
jgi:Ca2+-binding EF-hand superfamily protein